MTLSEIKKNGANIGKSYLLFLFVRRAMKPSVRMTEEYHSYPPRTTFQPIFCHCLLRIYIYIYIYIYRERERERERYILLKIISTDLDELLILYSELVKYCRKFVN